MRQLNNENTQGNNQMPNNRIRRRNSKNRGPNREQEELAQKRSVCMFSVNGNLHNIYQKPELTDGDDRYANYKEVEIGKPLVVRYLHHFLRFDEARNKEEQVMISSFVKTVEEKKPAAEAITYYNPSTKFSNGMVSIKSFSADTFGHELVYYAKSYTGQPVKLTTKIMELDNYDDVFSAISEGVENIGSMPFFMEYVPYLAVAKSANNFIQKLWKLFDKDDPIIPRLALNLFYGIPNSPVLQSGRYICIDSSTKTAQEFIDSGYKLSVDNTLQDKEGNDYKDSSYFIVQVNSEKRDEYEDFEYYQNAAELLAMVNRNSDMSDFISTAVTGFESYADLATIKEMEELQDDLDDAETLKKFKALYKSMSSEVKGLYRQKYKEILTENTEE